MLSAKKKTIVNTVILIVYIFLQVFLLLHHEAWRDESQAWILSRNASLFELLELCSSEGHPILWFVILKVCYLCGLSFYHLSALSVMIMTVAAALLLWKSPFTPLSNTFILLSPSFFYYNPVICRIYCVVVLLAVLLCVYWQKRREHPIVFGIIVALLLQSHILIAGIGIGCLLEGIIHFKETIRKKENVIGFGIQAASLLCMLLELKQGNDNDVFIKVNLEHILSRLNVKNMKECIDSVTKKMDSGVPLLGSILLWLFLSLIVAFILNAIFNSVFRKKAINVGIVSLCGMGCYWGIIILVRNAEHVQMAIVFMILLLFFAWTATAALKETGPKALPAILYEVMFVACCMITIPQSAYIDPVKDLKGPYSGSLEMAKLVEETVPENSIIVTHNDTLCTTMVAYLYDSEKNLILWDIDNGCEFRIHKWGRKNQRDISDDKLFEAILADCDGNQNVYYINSSFEVDPASGFVNGMTLIGKNTVTNTWSEYYQLYKVEMK